MSRLLTSVLLAIAVLVQCSPLRTCEWSALLAGHSCHDANVGPVGVDSGARAAEVVRHDSGPVTGEENTCVCNTPKGVGDRSANALPGGLDLAPFAAGPVLVFAPSSCPGTSSTGGNDAAPFGPNPPQQTPLLI